jgi:lysozyme
LILGIDVSSYQPDIDWPLVATAGRAFALIKATEGTSYVNPRFQSQWEDAVGAGLVRLAYHFFAWGNPVAEMDYFLTIVQRQGLSIGDGLAVDFERGGYPIPPSANDSVLLALTHLAEMAHFNPLLYSSPAFLAENNIGGGLNDFGLWLADWQTSWPVAPSPWPFWAIWQHAAAQSIPGVSTLCDSDVFNGTTNQLRRYGRLS